MIKLQNKLFLAAAITVCAAILPSALSAQTSGVGGDGYTRVLWRGTDGSISLWKLDGNLNYVTSHAYGPYIGWTPLAITTGPDSYTRVLWRATDGTVSLWLVDPNLNYISGKTYGPFYGWLAESISIDQADRLRLIWRETNGEVSVWMLDPNLNYLTSAAYGPYFGWDPASAAKASSGATAANSNATTGQATPDGMKQITPSIPIPPPQQ